MSGQKSILLVTVDCLRADHVGFMGYGRPTTPFLDSLAGESMVFPAAIAAGVPTYYSFPAILASRYPLALGRDVLGVSRDEPTLASVLKASGYATASFGAGNPYISSRFGYDRGFDTFRDFLTNADSLHQPEKLSDQGAGWPSRLNRSLQKIRPALGPLRAAYDEAYFHYCQRVTPVAGSLDALRRFPAADVIVDHACEWLESVLDAPFFLWLHFMDPHAPYYPKQEALRLMGEPAVSPFEARYANSYWNRGDLRPRRLAKRRQDIVRLYDAGIRWVDEQMARLAGRLRSAGLWENCILAFTADHGEEFLDHGGRFHPPSSLKEELIHVPLLLRAPGMARGKADSPPFSLLHLAPTLLQAAGPTIPAEFEGKSYWSQRPAGFAFESVAISECVAGCTNPFRPENRMGPRILSIRDQRYKLVLHFDSGGEELYDLEADADEGKPLQENEQKPVRRRLLEIAREHLLRSNGQRESRLRIEGMVRDLRLEWEISTHATSSAPI